MIRSWFASATAAAKGTTEGGDASASETTATLDDTGTFRPFPSSSSNAARSAVSNFGFGGSSRGVTGAGSRTTQQDARMERSVSMAARNLGDGVQKIVIAAKTKQGGSEWKTNLLNLLGNNSTSSETSDVDILLENSQCERFILRCVEAELPPNLIHCLRLVRVVELQNASAAKDKKNNDSNGSSASDDIVAPVALRATQKVTRLLCLLCKDSSVGEQLRPHLFGLLALSGASYPASGVHVANAASEVISAVADYCLTRQLVWFIHDRKMILHMTDDLKELTGLTQAAGGSVPMCLTGHTAEKAGLWYIAFSTVVRLISASCRFNTIDLVKDFEAAGGYEVLRFAIDHSTSPHGGKLVELLPDLICSPSRQPEENFDEANLKIAANVRPMLLQEDLLHRSNPLLKEFQGEHAGKIPNLRSEGTLRRLAFLSIKKAARLRSQSANAKPDHKFQFDMPFALLQATLQVFSDHPDNYMIIEGRQHILSFYLLSFSCYKDEDLKNFILKTLEFVLTGVGVSEEVTPVNACVEIFFALSDVLITGDIALQDESEASRDLILKALSQDAVLMGSTLEKLLQFDQRVAPLMIESGIMTKNLTTLLELIAVHNKKEDVPPAATEVDGTFCTVCNVLKLLVAHQPVGFSKQSDGAPTESDEPTDLHTLLRMAVHLLGEDACRAAAGVFESYLSSFASLEALKVDMTFVLTMIEQLAELSKGKLTLTILVREAVLLALLRSVLEGRSLARDAFRTCDGFTVILKILVALEGAFSTEDASDEVKGAALMKLLETIVGLIDASMGIKSKNALSVSEVSPVIIPDNVVVDPSSSQLSSADIPAPLNRNFIRQRGYYLDLAAAISGTGIMQTFLSEKVLELALGHVDPVLKSLGRTKVEDVVALRNPDAVRLVLGFVAFSSKEESNKEKAENILDELLRLTERKMAPTTLSQIASCGICWSLTNEDEFGPLLFSEGNPYQTKFIALLCRIASFGTSYVDFIGLLRRTAGPILIKGSEGRLIKLPVISSSLAGKNSGSVIQETKSEDSDFGSTSRNDELVPKLRALRDIAGYNDRFPRLCLGGDSINAIGVMMHQIKLEDRLRSAAEEGRLRFVEIESVDASALNDDSKGSETSAYGSTEPVWYPLSSSGFSYSCWLRHGVVHGSGISGSLYIMDISSPNLAEFASKSNAAFLGLWFDLQNQRFNVMSSASHRGEPICFPVSPLVPHVWHHILVTYTPGKRTMMSRKSVFSIFVDGRPLEAEVKVDSVSLPPNARMIMGAPNPALAASGIVRGKLPVWEMGPCFLIATVLLELDATAIYAYGPDFPGLLWGDRPERQSLSATASCLFGSLGEAGELGSVASALRRRDIGKMEAAGSNMTLHSENNDLAALNLYCTIPPETVIFGYQPGTVRWKIKNDMVRQDRKLSSERLANLATLGFCNRSVSTDAVVYGKGGVLSPLSLADALRWAGGPNIFMPIINAADSSNTLSLSLQILRECCKRHQPNLEAMQAGGGYRILAVLLQEKGMIDERCLDQCMSFAIYGFEPQSFPESPFGSNEEAQSLSHIHWVLSDLEAMKHILLNHQVWDLRKYGPSLPLRLLKVLNQLVDHKSLHKAFNARRLHMAGIVRWGLHLMIEASELFTAGDTSVQVGDGATDLDIPARPTQGWVCDAPYVSDVSAGGDPGNPFLQACKNLLRRVLTFMLTPGDLEALAEALVYTVSLTSQGGANATGKRANLVVAANEREREPRMLPASTTRLYLVRLLEELIVDGVNEIVASASTAHESKSTGVPMVEHTVQPHAGGIASPNQPYLAIPALKAKSTDGLFHPKHVQAQAFLGAFAGFLNPVWFATLLDGCREEASASAVVRLMVLLLQASTSFESAFQEAGEFGPFVMSIPRFSTCPSIVVSLLSQHFGVPILHIHALSSLDPENLCEVFDTEFENSGDEIPPSSSRDPANGIFALIAECIGRNLQLISSGSALKVKAIAANLAILHLLAHRHASSESFRRYCATPLFIEPFSQSLCLLYAQNTDANTKKRRRSKLATIPKDFTPTERFMGGELNENDHSFGFLRLLQQIISHALTLRGAARTVYFLFSSIPVHATPQEVKALYLLLIEQCTLKIEQAIDGDELLPIANSVGVLSVFLDLQVRGFSSTEAVINIVKISMKVLMAVTDRDSKAWGSPGPENSLVATDAAHIARLVCALSLRWSINRDDEDLQAEILALVEPNIELLLLVPSRERNVPVGPFPKVSPGSHLFPYWQSGSVSRCFPDRIPSFPDIGDSAKNADMAALAPLIVSLHSLLTTPGEELRGMAISVIVALLRHREAAMSELFVAQFSRGGQIETVDVITRGGFRALLAAHEAAEMKKTNSQSVKKRYASFFDWHEKNIDMVQMLFDKIGQRCLENFPGLEESTVEQEEAVENEQKHIIARITEQGSADQTILGGLQRADLSRRCTEKTAEYHSRWKRQGFDDLAFGATKWKSVLRQMKGSHSIWEGGQVVVRKKDLSMSSYFSQLKQKLLNGAKKDPEVLDFVSRWKLDLSEGYERQRRRLLPNHEFHGLYNLDEDAEFKTLSAGEVSIENDADFLATGGQMVATAELLKDLNLKRATGPVDEFDDAEADDTQTVATESTVLSGAESSANDGKGEHLDSRDKEEQAEEHTPEAGEDSSSYELINGLLQAGDYPERSYNIRRCTGLEVSKALLLWCSEALYIVDGFEQTVGEDMEPRINRVEKQKAIFNVALRQKSSVQDPKASVPSNSSNIKRASSKTKSSSADQPTSDVIYQHRSKRISFDELYAVFRRRYQLQQNALEFFDTNKQGTLVAFDGNKEREEVLGKILQSRLPNSIFNSTYGAYVSYGKVMANLKTNIETQWVNGKMTNFDFLMHLNSLAGRSFNDLTQYPVFPWVISDYESEELDLDDPSIYRDLSKPMGALSPERANQFQERYESLESMVHGEDDPPPFHYGTHYSTSAYVLYYLMRLEPFSRLALALQGGRFDVADRLFHDVGHSWRNASVDNLQDVRELIPEFYYLPDFLVNTNGFDFGETQKGKTVDDVTLPKWAKGDPHRFVRMNRKALESPHVSKNLHKWADLIFGFKQRGEEAIKALNTFVHVTYEGEVDIDSMSDPIQRESTIAQIQNFGQTPKQLEKKPFAARTVVSAIKDNAIDFSTIAFLAPLTPPLCVAGAPQRNKIRPILTETAKVGMVEQSDKAVGDICYHKGYLIGTGRTCALLVDPKKYVRFGGVNNGLSVHNAMVSTRYREVDKVLTIHDGLHRAPICAVKASQDGSWIVTGSIDSTLRVWRYDGDRMTPKATLCGHSGSPINCIDISTEFGMIATGCACGRVLLWDLRSLTFVRALQHEGKDEAALSVSINHTNGNVVTLVGTWLTIYDINGKKIATKRMSHQNAPSCVVATNCPEWMDNGVVAVSGHINGEIRLWGLDYEVPALMLLLIAPENPHTNPISVLRVTGTDRQDTLLAGDRSGKITVFKTVQLENMSSDELNEIIDEVS